VLITDSTRFLQAHYFRIAYGFEFVFRGPSMTLPQKINLRHTAEVPTAKQG
jgi:hypothetical protein